MIYVRRRGEVSYYRNRGTDPRLMGNYLKQILGSGLGNEAVSRIIVLDFNALEKSINCIYRVH